MCSDYREDKYKPIRKNIERIFYGEENYDKALKYTKDFLDLIKREEASDYNFHFTFMMFSKIYNNKNQKDRAIAYAKMSRKYLMNYIQIKTLVIENKWQFAMCYKGIDDRKAIAYFNDCLKISESNNLYQHVSGLLEEIALIENSINKMKKSIDVFENKAEVDDKVYKQNRLDNLYCSLFNIYIANNDEVNARRTIHNIKNESKVNNLKAIMKLKASKLA